MKMERCPKCGQELYEKACYPCGLWFCPSCGKPNLVGLDQCEHCGNRFKINENKLTENSFSSGLEKGLSPREHQSHWNDFFRASPEELNSSFEIVRSSSFIRNTPPYADAASRVQFQFHDDNPMINAFADKMDRIVLFGGLVCAQRLAAGVFSLLDNGANPRTTALNSAEGLLTALLRAIRRKGRMTPEQAVAAFRRFGPFGSETPDSSTHLTVARSVASAGQAYVIAHELGHIALGHTQANVPWSEEVQRNQERETDSFASSTLSQAPFAEYLFLGQVATLFILMSNQRKGDSDLFDSHPNPESRFQAAFESNPSLAERTERRFGITRQILLEAWKQVSFN